MRLAKLKRPRSRSAHGVALEHYRRRARLGMAMARPCNSMREMFLRRSREQRMEGEREARMGRDVQLAVGVAPVVPPVGDDGVVHVGVGEDDAGEGAPGAAQVERAGPRHPAVDEGEPRVLQHALPVLRRQRPVVPRDRVHVAVLQQQQQHVSISHPSIFYCSSSLYISSSMIHAWSHGS